MCPLVQSPKSGTEASRFGTASKSPSRRAAPRGRRSPGRAEAALTTRRCAARGFACCIRAGASGDGTRSADGGDGFLHHLVELGLQDGADDAVGDPDDLEEEEGRD